MKFAKITTIMLWVFLGITIVLVISLLSNLSETDSGRETWINANLYWAYTLFFISIGAALIMEFVNTATDKKATKSALVAIGFMGVIVGISYMMSSSEIPTFFGVEKFIESGVVNESVSKWIGTGLIATYILSALAVLGIVWSSISSIFR